MTVPGDEELMEKEIDKKEKCLLENISREKWIAGAFVLIILCVPILTIMSKLFWQEEAAEDDTGRTVLQGNGTLTGDGVRGVESQETEEIGSRDETEEETWLRALLDCVYDFAEELFFKDELISLSRALTKTITGNTYIESTRTLLGKENWLFFKTKNEDDGDPILDYKGLNHFQENELATMAENLTEIRDYLEEERGIRFVAMCVPNKENVYPEYMPDIIPKLVEQSRADQVAEYLWGNTDLDYIYPKEIMLREKGEYQIFYKTDTHWNQIGAFVGLQAFFDQIYGTYASPDSVQFIATDRDYAGDLATIAGVAEDYVDTIYVLDVNSVDPGQYRDEVLMIVGDSFSGFLSTVAEPYYKKVYRVESKEFTMSMLDTYQPDIVIWQTVERVVEILAYYELGQH